MAYSAQVATDINDAALKLKNWAVTNGWTSNSFIDDSSKYSGDTFTGKRCHLQKTKDGTVCYVNFRTSNNQVVFSYSSYDSVTGFNLYVSTEYDSGNDWDEMQAYSTDITRGMCADAIKTSSINCYFFASDSGNSIYAVFDGDDSDYTILSFGFNSQGFPCCFASGGARSGSASGLDYRRLYLTGIASTMGASGMLLNGTNIRYFPYDWNQSVWYFPSIIGGGLSYNIVGSLVSKSVDKIKGNTVLNPCMLYYYDDYDPYGYLLGIKYVNMSNYSSLDEVTYDSNTYKMFRVSTESSSIVGVAILK